MCFIASSHKNCGSPDASNRACVCSVCVHIPHLVTPFCCSKSWTVEFTLCASYVLVPCEVIGEKFSPSIGACYFDVISGLCLDECFIVLVGINGLALLHLEIECGFVGCIIYVCCHVQVSTEASDWSRSPQVPVDVLSVFCCMSFWFPQEGLPSHFGPGTCLAEFRLWLRVKLDTGNVAFCNHILDSWRCNVAKFLVGFTNGQLDHHNACIVDSGGSSAAVMW